MERALPWLILLGLGGVALWLVLRKPADAEAPCGVPVSVSGFGTVIPCETVKTVTKGLQGLLNAPGAIAGTISEGFGSKNNCPPGTTDQGWRGCLTADGQVVGHGGTAPVPLTAQQSAVVTSVGSVIGSGTKFTSAGTPALVAKWGWR